MSGTPHRLHGLPGHAALSLAAGMVYGSVSKTEGMHLSSGFESWARDCARIATLRQRCGSSLLSPQTRWGSIPHGGRQPPLGRISSVGRASVL